MRRTFKGKSGDDHVPDITKATEIRFNTRLRKIVAQTSSLAMREMLRRRFRFLIAPNAVTIATMFAIGEKKQGPN